jgi:hypothetical protein
MSKEVDITEFARTVERLCDYLLENVEKDGSKDVVIIQELKEDAANVQVFHSKANLLKGLDNHMRGLKES